MLGAADFPDDIAALKAMLIAAQAREAAKDVAIASKDEHIARKDERIERLEKLVAAFKQALVNAAGRAPQAPVEPGVATRSGPLLPPSPALTGFEDTVMPSQEGRSPDLSSTQYGDLR